MVLCVLAWSASPVLPQNKKRAYVVVCFCSVICLSSVFHHMSGENWEKAAAGTLGRWAYPESKRAMVRLAKVRVE